MIRSEIDRLIPSPRLLGQAHRRMEDAGTEGACPLLHRSRLRKDAVKGSINLFALFAGMTQHPEQPIFHCPAIQVLDDMNDAGGFL
ncbi:MAG: hypothetical protein WBE72_02640 [Terracidiphilus sp.]